MAISKHLFLFPFKWSKPKADLSYSPFINNEVMDEFEKKLLSLANWEAVPYTQFNSEVEYNEYNYFYANVREALYSNTESTDTILKHFNFKKNPGENYLGSYQIQLDGKAIKDKKKSPENLYPKGITYELDLIKINLNIYQTGVGILSFHTENNKHSNVEDILAINQFGRRIAPPFLPISACKNEELAESLKLILNGHEFQTEDFAIFEGNNYQQLESVGFLPLFFKQLLPIQEFKIENVLDDRMFVICWYGAEQSILDALAKIENNVYGYQKEDFWYKYVYVDVNEKTMNNALIQKEIIEKNTYSRWIDKKYKGKPSPTLYGVSRYSFVCVSSDGNFLASQHTPTIYYKMVELCLLYRISILNFGEMVSRISGKLNNLEIGEEISKDLNRDVERLSKAYIQFVNKIYFREVTHQDQGIELYDMLNTTMNNNKLISDLKLEIQELNSFVGTLAQNQQNLNAVKLTEVATLFLPLTVVLGVFGINTLDDEMFINFLYRIGVKNVENPFIYSIGFCLILSVVLFVIVSNVLGLKNSFNFRSKRKNGK
ncbi:MAG: hypothetical protein IPN14_17055 [Bacteroidetes bacterium]|nr:hypothetical protein [Bacteroidota bacterium]